MSAGQEEKQDRERRTGQQQEAQEHLAVATAMYREMDMTFWLEQAEAEQKA